MASQESIGDADFQELLAAGAAAAAQGDTFDPTALIEGEMDELLAGTQELNVSGSVPPGLLMTMPEMTQDVTEVTDADDDRELELMHEKFNSQNAKSVRQKDLYSKMHMMEAGGCPYDKLHEMGAKIEEMPDGEDKAQSAAVFNAAGSLFQTARTNEGLRVFLVELFSSQKMYYEYKEERKATKKELRMLTALYDEHEYKKTMEELEKKKAERREMLEKKGKEKSAKDAAKAAESASKRAKTA